MYETKHTALAGRLKNAIRKGTYTGKLPGVHALAAEYGVNFKTMNKAVNALVNEGLLITRKGEGRFVASSPDGVRAGVIALLVRTEGHLFSDLAAGLVRHAQARGMTAMVMDAPTFDGSRAATARLREHKAGALITDIASEAARDFVEQHGREFRHVVVLGRHGGNLTCPVSRVHADAHHGMRTATTRLLDAGRRNVALMHYEWVYGTDGYEHTEHGLTVEGYRSALRSRRIAKRQRFMWVTSDDDSNERALRSLFADEATRPDGLVTYMDSRAVWACRILADLGLRVPEDVAVIGYNNTPWCELVQPRLTSVSVKEDELARLAVAKAAEAQPVLEDVVVTPELVVRESCGTAGGAPGGRARRGSRKRR